MFDMFQLPKDVTRVWDLPVPIVPGESETHVYITDQIGEPADYNELCHLLKSATRGHKFHIHINTPGGILDSAFMIVDALNNTTAHTIAHLTGTVASAGTIIALSCNELVVSNHIAFMIHNYSGAIGGKGHEMKSRQKFTDESIENAFKEFYTGFLTPEEMQEVIDGRDMWMGTTEVQERWANKIKPASIKKGK